MHLKLPVSSNCYKNEENKSLHIHVRLFSNSAQNKYPFIDLQTTYRDFCNFAFLVT